MWDGLFDAVRYIAWAIWLLTLPFALFFMLPLWMSTSRALGGDPGNWLLVLINLAWIIGVPVLLVIWGLA